MDVTQIGLTMFLGALVAAAGLVLLFLRTEHAENIIKIGGQEFKISTPALVVLLIGVFVFILPSIIQMQNQPVFSIHPRGGPEPGRIRDGAGNQFPTAKLIKMGTTVSGVMNSAADRHFYKFKTGEGLKTRVILTKPSRDGFNATVAIYDDVQNNVASGSGWGEDSVSIVFQSSQNSYYYVKVESFGSSDRGPYELVIREE